MDAARKETLGKQWTDFQRAAKERAANNAAIFNAEFYELPVDLQLKKYGIAIFPLYEITKPADIRKKAGELREEFRATCKSFPEFKEGYIQFEDEPPHSLIGVKNKGGVISSLSMGGFGAFGTPSSFHNNFVRSRRREVMESAFRNLWKPYLKEKENFKLEQIIDRMMLRLKKTSPTAEVWHRDVAKNTAKDDETYGGWINFDDADQGFSCVPGSYKIRIPSEYSSKPNGAKKKNSDDDTGCNEGFATIQDSDHGALKDIKIRIKVPSLHVLVFNEQTVHEIATSTSSADMYRLFTGWRITTDDMPLQDKNIPEWEDITYGPYEAGKEVTRRKLETELKRQSAMPLKSGQSSPMWARLHWTNFPDLLILFSNGLKDDPEMIKHNFKVQFSKNPETMRIPRYIVPRYLSSLEELNLQKYADYEKKDIEILYPARDWPENNLHFDTDSSIDTSADSDEDATTFSGSSPMSILDADSSTDTLPEPDEYDANYDLPQTLNCPIDDGRDKSCNGRRYASISALNEHLKIKHKVTSDQVRKKLIIEMQADAKATKDHHFFNGLDSIINVTWPGTNQRQFCDYVEILKKEFNSPEHIRSIRRAFLEGAHKIYDWKDTKLFLATASGSLALSFTPSDFLSIWYQESKKVLEMIKYFNFKDAKYQEQDDRGNTALHVFLDHVPHDVPGCKGSRNFYDELLTLFITKTNLDIANVKGQTPLIVAFLNDNPCHFWKKFVKIAHMQKKNISIGLKDNNNCTAEDYYLDSTLYKYRSLNFDDFYDFVPLLYENWSDDKEKMENVFRVIKYGFNHDIQFLNKYMKKYFESDYALPIEYILDRSHGPFQVPPIKDLLDTEANNPIFNTIRQLNDAFERKRMMAAHGSPPEETKKTRSTRIAEISTFLTSTSGKLWRVQIYKLSFFTFICVCEKRFFGIYVFFLFKKLK